MGGGYFLDTIPFIWIFIPFLPWKKHARVIKISILNFAPSFCYPISNVLRICNQEDIIYELWICLITI